MNIDPIVPAAASAVEMGIPNIAVFLAWRLASLTCGAANVFGPKSIFGSSRGCTFVPCSLRHSVQVAPCLLVSKSLVIWSNSFSILLVLSLYLRGGGLSSGKPTSRGLEVLSDCGVILVSLSFIGSWGGFGLGGLGVGGIGVGSSPFNSGVIISATAGILLLLIDCYLPPLFFFVVVSVVVGVSPPPVAMGVPVLCF